MELFLTGLVLGLVVTVLVMIIFDENRFVPRHMSLAITNGLGLALILPSGYNNATMNAVGVMVFIGGIILCVRLSKPKPKTQEDQKQTSTQKSA